MTFAVFEVVSHCVSPLSPNSITPTFTETSPQGKSWTQIVKVTDTNHLDISRCLRQSLWQVRDKPVCVALMEFSSLQCTEKFGDKVRDKFVTKQTVTNMSRTQVMKVCDVICVTDFHDLCLQQVHNFVGNLSWTLSQSWRNGIWALRSV